MQTTFRMINAETQLLYSSDYPHWDFDLPSTIWDLPFLSEKGKHNILGGTAARLFKLPPRNEKQKENLQSFGNLVAALIFRPSSRTRFLAGWVECNKAHPGRGAAWRISRSLDSRHGSIFAVAKIVEGQLQ